MSVKACSLATLLVLTVLVNFCMERPPIAHDIPFRKATPQEDARARLVCAVGTGSLENLKQILPTFRTFDESLQQGVMYAFLNPCTNQSVQPKEETFYKLPVESVIAPAIKAKILDHLITCGLNPHGYTHEGHGYIFRICLDVAAKGHLEVLEVLLKHNINPN